MIIVKNLINQLRNEYYDHPVTNELLELKSRNSNSTFIFSKLEILDLIEYYYFRTKDAEHAYYLTEQLSYGFCVQSRQLELIKRLQEEIKNKCRYNNIEQIKKECEKCYRINSEIYRFNGFKNNQNLFDNFLSLLKIQDVLRQHKISITFNELFDSQNANEENLLNELKNECRLRFNGLRFQF